MGRLYYRFFRAGHFRAGAVKDERGAVLLMTVLLMTVLLLMAGLVSDFARAWVAREQLQTAVDAAALSGARNGVRYVTVTVQRGHEECETSCDEWGCYTSCWCEDDGIEETSGTEKYILEQGGWEENHCDSLLGTEERWIVFPYNTYSVADGMLDANWPDLLSGDNGQKDYADISEYESGPYYPSVAARAGGRVETTFLKITGIEDLPVSRCGQAGTFYEVISNGWRLGRNAAPKDACQ